MKPFAIVAIFIVVGVTLFSKYKTSPPMTAEIFESEPIAYERKDVFSLKAEMKRRPAQIYEKKDVSTTVEGVRTSIRTLISCYESDCGLGERDGKGPYFEIGRRIKEKLNLLEKRVQTDDIVEESISELARENVENSDGHVKEAALDLFATQPTSEENMEAILKGVIADTDAELIEQGLLELSRYDRGNEQDKVNLALQEALLHGSPFVALRIAEQIGSILSAASYSFFARLASQMDDESQVKAALLRGLNASRYAASAQ